MSFRRRIKIAPGLHINFSKSGISTSIGKPGATVNIGNKGVKTTLGIPGTGVSYSHTTKANSCSSGTVSVRKSTSKWKALLPLLFLIMAVVMNSGEEEQQSAKFMIVEASSLRVRSAPSINSKVINQFVSGQAVEVLETQGNWSLVRNEKIEGWVATNYLIKSANSK